MLEKNNKQHSLKGEMRLQLNNQLGLSLAMPRY